MPVFCSYLGRFAPSPTGPMHLGSLVAALASWLDARAYGLRHGYHRQRWLVRIEDTDRHRCQPGADAEILRQLDALGLRADEKPQWQSAHADWYAAALQQLRQMRLAYPCQCTRKDIEAAWQARGAGKNRFATLVYPGTCRHLPSVAPVRSWRFRTDVAASVQESAVTEWCDRALGPQAQNVQEEVGDFVLLRADGMWSYQLACVVDDARQGITHIVRGADLLDNTARQILLQRALHYPQPRYLHIPLAVDAMGEKLSKSNGAASIDVSRPLIVLQQAAQVLQLGAIGDANTAVPEALAQWVSEWARRHADDI